MSTRILDGDSHLERFDQLRVVAVDHVPREQRIFALAVESQKNGIDCGMNVRTILILTSSHANAAVTFVIVRIVPSG